VVSVRLGWVAGVFTDLVDEFLSLVRGDVLEEGAEGGVFLLGLVGLRVWGGDDVVRCGP